MISVILLGAGNVATHLYKVFKTSEEIELKQWYNRRIDAISSYKYETSITDNIKDLEVADLYILAVNDDVISELSSQISFKGKLVAHTSGSVSIHALDQRHQRAVFYPLQTFTKDKTIDFKNVPFCIEVFEKHNLKILKEVAEAIGSPSYKINAEQRQTLHLSAVFINNFTNQLYRIAHEISDAKSINFNILKPLILETANKVQDMSPYMAQTGPAKRNDKKTIKRHLKQLENEEYKILYDLMTTLIKKTHHL